MISKLDTKGNLGPMVRFYAILYTFTILVMAIFGVNDLRLFKSMYPRWTGTPRFMGEELILLTLIIVGIFGGYFNTRIRFPHGYSPNSIEALGRIHRSALICTIPIIGVSTAISVDSLLSSLGTLILVSNILNVIALMQLSTALGAILYVKIYGKFIENNGNKYSDVALERAIILSIVIIIAIRAVQALFISPLAGWDSIYHNQIIDEIVNGGNYTVHPFYTGMANLYPPLYHLFIAYLVIISGLPLSLIVIVKEILVFSLIALTTYRLSHSLGFGRITSLLSAALAFAFLPGGGNQPQSLAFLFLVCTLYFLYISQDRNKMRYSFLSGVVCGLLILTHYGIAIAAALTLAFNLIYHISKRSFSSARMTANTLWIAATIGSISLFQSLSVFTASGNIVIIFIGGIGGCLLLTLILFRLPSILKVEEEESARIERIEIAFEKHANHDFKKVFYILVTTIVAISIVWGYFVGLHGYGLIAYGIAGIFVPFGIVSMLILPFAVGGYYELSYELERPKKGILYSGIIPAILGFGFYQTEIYFSSVLPSQLEVIQLLFSFSPYYLLSSVVVLAITTSYFVVERIAPNIRFIETVTEVRVITSKLRIKQFGLVLLIISILLAGSLSGRVAELTASVKQGTAQRIHQNEIVIFGLIGTLTDDSDVVLADTYTSVFIPTYANRKVFASIHETANDFQINRIIERVALADSILSGPDDQILLGLQSLQVDVVFIWKQYPLYFRDQSTIETKFRIDFDGVADVLSASPEVDILSQTSEYILLRI